MNAEYTRSADRFHSLSPAVRAGLISAERAACGLSPADVHLLGLRMPHLKVVVRFRSSQGDNRALVDIGRVAAAADRFERSDGEDDVAFTRYVQAPAGPRRYSEIRDILAAAS